MRSKLKLLTFSVFPTASFVGNNFRTERLQSPTLHARERQFEMKKDSIWIFNHFRQFKNELNTGQSFHRKVDVVLTRALKAILSVESKREAVKVSQ